MLVVLCHMLGGLTSLVLDSLSFVSISVAATILTLAGALSDVQLSVENGDYNY